MLDNQSDEAKHKLVVMNYTRSQYHSSLLPSIHLSSDKIWNSLDEDIGLKIWKHKRKDQSSKDQTL